MNNNFLFVNAKRNISIQSKIFWNEKHPLYLRNNSGDFSANNMKNKTELNGFLYGFFVDYQAFDTSNIINIHKLLMKKHDI